MLAIAITSIFLLEYGAILFGMAVQDALGIKYGLFSVTSNGLTSLVINSLMSLILFINGWFGFFAGASLFRNSKHSKILSIIFLSITGLGFILFSYLVPAKGFDYITQLLVVAYGMLIINLISIVYLLIKK